MEALSSLSLSTGREPFYAHNYLVVFGEGCGEEGLDRSLDFFIRYYNTRPAVGLYFTQGSAAEVLSFEQDGALFPMQDLQALSQTGEENGASGFCVRCGIWLFNPVSHQPGHRDARFRDAAPARINRKRSHA